jgi:fumarate hydratase, class I
VSSKRGDYLAEEMSLVDAFVELYRRTACTLPKDVLRTLDNISRDAKTVDANKRAQAAKIVDFVKKNGANNPLKADPVMPIFYLNVPEHWSEVDVVNAIKDATKIATKKGYLPPSIQDITTGELKKDNIGHGVPQIQTRSWINEFMRANLLLQSGESMNVSLQYSLPDKELKAERNLEGVKKCVLDCVENAHGLHWPAFLGVAIGGDRVLSRLGARKQLFRTMDEPNEDKELEKIEKDLAEHEDISSVNICTFTTLPACYFVTVEYTGWTCRRQGFDYANGLLMEWHDSGLSKSHKNK